jgi:hypothetical protein
VDTNAARDALRGAAREKPAIIRLFQSGGKDR